MTIEQQLEFIIVIVFFLALPSFLFLLYVSIEILENHHNTKPQNKNTKENPK